MPQEWRDAILLRRWQQPEMPLRDRQFGIFREIAQNLNAFAGNGRLQVARMASTSEAMRLIEQRGLKLDGEVVSDKSLVVAPGTTVVVQAGKRKFARVTIA